MSDEKKPMPQKMRGTVERGRTVVVPHPTKTRVVSYTPEGKPVSQPVYLTYGPGMEVELPAEEIAFFRERGYIVDPTKKAPVSATDSGMVTTIEQRNRELNAEQVRNLR